MEANAAKARIERRYRLTDDALPSALASLLRFARDFVGPETEFRGSLRRSSAPDVSLDFDDADGFIAATAGEILEFNAGFGASWSDVRSVEFRKYRRDTEVSLTVTVEPASLAEARSSLNEAERLAAIAPLPEDGDAEPMEQNARLERQYFCRQPSASRWIELFEAMLMPLVGLSDIRARVKSGEADAAECRYGDLTSLRAALPATIDRLDLDASAKRPPFPSVSLSFDRSYQPALRIVVEAPHATLEQARPEIDRFEAALGLRRFVEHSEEHRDRVGSLVTCFTASRLDQDWFRRACAAIDDLEPWPRWFNGHLSERSDGSERTRHSSLARWQAAVLERWPRLHELNAELDGHTYGVFLHLEPRLDFVRIRVTARDETTADARLEELLKHLDLERQGSEPYTEARSMRTFRIETWDRASYVQTLRGVLRRFVSTEPVLIRAESYVAESDGKGGQKLVHYDDLEDLIAHLASDKAYVGASVLAKGPRGRMLRLDVHDECSVLEVRSSFETGQFTDLVGALRKGLSLAEPEVVAKLPQRGFWGQFWRAEGLPGHIATLLAGAVVTAIGFLAVNAMPSYDIQLMRPFARADQAAVVEAGCVEVTWLVVQNHWPKRGTRLEGETGDVNLGPAGGRRLAPVRGHRSGDEIHVPPGRWTLSVSDPQRGAASTVIEMQAEDAGYGIERQAFEARCGRPPDAGP